MQAYAASVSMTTRAMRIALVHPGRVLTTKQTMKRTNAPKSIAARGAKRDRYSASHSTLGIPMRTQVRTPTSFIFCSFTPGILEVVARARRGHAADLHVGELAGTRAGELGVDHIDAHIRAQPSRDREPRQQRAVAQIGDGDQLRIELVVRDGDANEGVVAGHVQRRIGGIRGAKGPFVVRGAGGEAKIAKGVGVESIARVIELDD